MGIFYFPKFPNMEKRRTGKYFYIIEKQEIRLGDMKIGKKNY